MGYFKNENIKNGDATVKVVLMAGLTPLEVLAKVWIQPVDPSVGIMESYVEEYELLDKETEEKLDPKTENLIEITEGSDNIMKKIETALKELTADWDI